MWAMRRTMTEGLSTQLSGFFACASELHLKDVVAPILDELSVCVLSSADERAKIEFAVGDEGIDMQISRAALALAAEQVDAQDWPVFR